MTIKYTAKDIANICEIVTEYYMQINLSNQSFYANRNNLLRRIEEMKTIPENIRNSLTIVKADNNTLNILEKKCRESKINYI